MFSLSTLLKITDKCPNQVNTIKVEKSSWKCHVGTPARKDIQVRRPNTRPLANVELVVLLVERNKAVRIIHTQ